MRHSHVIVHSSFWHPAFVLGAVGSDVTSRVAYWLLLALVLGFLGMAVVLALLATWRNYNRRQQLLEKGRELRRAYRGEPREKPWVDVWSASADRYREPGDKGDDDQRDHEDGSDGPRGSHGPNGPNGPNGPEDERDRP